MRKLNDLNFFELKQLFFESCSKNNVLIVEQLLTNKHYRVDVSSEEYLGLRCACTYGSVDVLKYLLTPNKSFDMPDIHAKNDSAFKSAARMLKYDVLEYLILDKNIQKTEEITKYLNKNPNKVIDNLFKLRELDSQLSFDFSDTNKSPKI